MNNLIFNLIIVKGDSNWNNNVGIEVNSSILAYNANYQQHGILLFSVKSFVICYNLMHDYTCRLYLHMFILRTHTTGQELKEIHVELINDMK